MNILKSIWESLKETKIQMAMIAVMLFIGALTDAIKGDWINFGLGVCWSFLSLAFGTLFDKLDKAKEIIVLLMKMLEAKDEYQEHDKDNPYLPDELKDDLSDNIVDYMEHGTEFDEGGTLSLAFNVETDDSEYDITLTCEKIREKDED